MLLYETIFLLTRIYAFSTFLKIPFVRASNNLPKVALMILTCTWILLNKTLRCICNLITLYLASWIRSLKSLSVKFLQPYRNLMSLLVQSALMPYLLAAPQQNTLHQRGTDHHTHRKLTLPKTSFVDRSQDVANRPKWMTTIYWLCSALHKNVSPLKKMKQEIDPRHLFHSLEPLRKMLKSRQLFTLNSKH